VATDLEQFQAALWGETPEWQQGTVADQSVYDETERVLIEEYQIEEEQAEEMVPDSTYESLQASGAGWQELGSDTADAAGSAVETVTDPTSVLPWWTPWAAGGVALLVVLLVARPYANLAAGVID
jgi:hypothetical protein